jgi:azurin
MRSDSLQFSQGIFQFTPGNKKINDLQYLGATSNNTWGLGFSEENDVFASTANNTHSVFMGIPKRYLVKAGIKDPGTEKIDAHYGMHVVTKNLRQVDVFGGFTAAAGHSLYTARTFPKEYWNRIAFVCEPTGRLIHRHVLEQKGSGFWEEGDGWNMMAGADEWFGPVQAEVGPDGNLWVADWYDFIIQHNPTPEGFENGKGNAHINPLRDRSKGRIYRVSFKEGKKSVQPSFNKNDLRSYVQALENDNMFWRNTAQRLLVEANDKSVLPALYTIIRDSRTDEAGINAAAIHALWTMHGLKVLDGKNTEAMNVAATALKNSSAGVRKAAVQVLPRNVQSIQAMKKAGIFNDKDLRVRLAGVLAIADMKPFAEGKNIITEMSGKDENKNDKWISMALDATSMTYRNNSVTSEKNKTTAAKIDRTIDINVTKGTMKFDKELIEVKAGTTVRIRLRNPDFMQHNLLIIMPNSLEKVGKAADQLAQDPKGAEKNYIPSMPEVLHATPLVDPEGSYTLTFKVPASAGDYPYICTFPGHWRIMKGIMRVTK